MPASPSGTGIDRVVISPRRRRPAGASRPGPIRRPAGASRPGLDSSSGWRLPTVPDSSSGWRLPTVSKSNPNSDNTTSRMAPPTTDGSATLNTGHHPMDRKSTTWPRSGPGDRKNRSTRLPIAPPRIMPEPERPPRRHQPTAHPDDADDHARGDQREHPGVAGGHRERRTRVAHQRPRHGVADDRHRLTGREQLHGEHLRDDVQNEHHPRHGQQQAQPARRRHLPAARRHCRRSRARPGSMIHQSRPHHRRVGGGEQFHP